MNTKPSVCRLSDFFEAYMPNEGLQSLDSVISELEKQKILATRARSGNQRPSSLTGSPGYTHLLTPFKGLFRGFTKPHRLIKSLQLVGDAVRRALAIVKGTDVSTCSIRGSDAGDAPFLDAYLTANAHLPLRCADVVVPIRAIGAKACGDQMESEIIALLSRIMKEDARRRFIYAITIERNQVWLWYHSRSQCVIAEPFSLTEHPDLLIKVLTCLLSASSERLGYDPLVTLLPDSSYVYELPPDGNRTEPLFYQTVELLSQLPAADVGGRSSLHMPGTPERVLKDVTLDNHVRTEADAQQQLFRDIIAVSRDEAWRSREILKDFPKHHLDSLAEALRDDNYKKFFSCIIAKCIRPCTISPSLPHSNCTHKPKRRCFFVYELVCKPLSDIATLGEAVDLLKQSLTALQIMFCAGWVHCDVSSGNILGFRTGQDARWQVKLSDLEFAKRFPPEGDGVVEESRMGTPQFMAWELQSSRHFLPPTTEIGMARRTAHPKKPVVHNYQHDLEPLFWILLWLLTMRSKLSPSRAFGDLFFQQTASRVHIAARGRLVSSEEGLVDDPDLPRSLPPPLHRESPFVMALDILRSDLYVEYVTRNGTGSQDDVASYSWIMSEGVSNFFSAIEDSQREWSDIELLVDSDTQPAHRDEDDHLLPAVPPSTKRKPVESETGHDQQGPRKRLRLVSTNTPPLPQRSGPVTRSMTRNQANIRPNTRSVTRRLQKSNAQSGPASPTLARKTRR
ncbi:other/FunK1 protein kinase [Coprinopsis cinerea okayama7|uniref:Other/FunK1 protein kinase n=1 Tax=Coprinopsis cinerea (strain Okayama-7 / 130 / ATCC MYA-4618 / FGSC 9003) TaxID=240176 RepID=A8NE30_COPC7|nr:other/FunK1 protein kinase [Coprinopsis cinerea okayama7\|eukprot:XP_001832932.2 other/FunK1 protein kinase [Coprinopsis cinerea okayama7\